MVLLHCLFPLQEPSLSALLAFYLTGHHGISLGAVSGIKRRVSKEIKKIL